MRILLSVTRAPIGAATTAHIKSLRVAVNASERSHNAAMRATDAASLAHIRAAQECDAAVAYEKVAHERHTAFLCAAQAEADSLRRGVTL